MGFKKAILVLLLLIILTMGAASAADTNTTSDNLAATEDTNLELSENDDFEDKLGIESANPISDTGNSTGKLADLENAMSLTKDNHKEDKIYDDILSVQNDLNVLNTNYGTYSELSTEIGSGGNIELNCDYYTYDSGSSIEITVDNSVIDGKGAVIDMAGSSSMQAFKVTASDVTIKNLTIKNANYNGNGGAIYFSNSSTVTNCNFTNNKADYGGAVYFGDEGTVTNCNFINNIAFGDYGKGGAVYFSNSSTVTNCNFTDNKAWYAGAVYFKDNGEVTNCNFADHKADGAGAVYFGGSGSVENCNFTNNLAGGGYENAYGGAINMISGTVTNCNFTNNQATDNGGAVYIGSNGTVTNCNFTNNSAYESGGAVYFYNAGRVSNCNFTNNSAYESGGAVYIRSNGTVTNCNFTNNKAIEYNGRGGAVYIMSNGTVTNSNFTNNQATDNGGAICFDSTGNDNVSNCNFINCSAELGKAIHANDNTLISNCNFETQGSESLDELVVGGIISNCTINGNKEKTETNMTVTVDDITYGENATFTVTLPPDATGILNITVGNMTFTADIGNEPIIAEISGLDIGTYIANITYTGDLKYLPANANETFTVSTKGNKTFTDLKNLIDSASSGDTIELDDDYTNDGSITADGITISKPITIDGNGHTLNANGKSGLFKLNVDNIILNNIEFLNASHEAISVSGSNCKIINCNFNNCSPINSSSDYGIGGGVVSMNSGSIVNCSFINCVHDIQKTISGGVLSVRNSDVINCRFFNCTYGCDLVYGGAIYLSKSRIINCSFSYCGDACNIIYGGAINGEGSVINCTFSNCTIDSSYSAYVHFEGPSNLTNSIFIDCISAVCCNYGCVGNITNCTFEACSVSAIGFWCEGGNVTDCKFNDCTSTAIYVHDSYVNIVGCIFKNCSSDEGGAINIVERYDNVINCSFIDCSAERGGAIYAGDCNNTIINCSFINCSAQKGGSIYWNSKNGKILNSNFTHSQAENGGAIYVDKDIILTVSSSKFEYNTAEQVGGAIYFNVLGNVTNCTFNGNSNPEIYPNNRTSDTNSTFTELKDLIDSASPGDVLELDKDYQNDGSISSNGITISKAITIDGKGHTLDALSHSRIFNILSDGVIIKNIKFINGRCTDGGAIYCNGANCSVVNSSFNKNEAEDYYTDGGAIHATGSKFTIVNSNFTENKAPGNGGAVRLTGDNCEIFNCSFSDNEAAGDGGAVITNGENCIISNSKFNNNVAVIYNGGAVRNTGNYCIIRNSTFIGNRASSHYGGAIKSGGANPIISNSVFIDNHAIEGGAFFVSVGFYSTVINSSFINNTADDKGGAINFDILGNVTGCTFSGNSDPEIYSNNNTLNINSTFTELKDLIDSANSGDTIDLSGYYYGSGSSISIDKTITLRGNGETVLDAKGLSSILSVSANNVRIENIKFVNGQNSGDWGGAIHWEGDSGVLINSTFVNNVASWGAGIFWWAQDGYMANCTFENNTAERYGGALYVNGEKLRMLNSLFKNNIVTESISSWEGGGAIYTDGNNHLVANSTFIDNKAINSWGGAIKHGSETASYQSNEFYNNTAIRGNSVWESDANNLVNNIFNLNSIDEIASCVEDANLSALFENNIFKVKGIVISKDDYFNETDTGSNESSQNITQSTFTDITNLISNAHAGDTINLEGTYYGTGLIITVNKELTIKGNGETILDAKNLSGILSVSADNVRINNIRFINGKINANGGAINWIGKNGAISNCTFINCSAENGGSVYWNAENGRINTSRFDHSTATQNGGAIYWNANSGEIANSIFTNSYAQNGGAVYVPENRTVEIKSSIFDSNMAEEESGAVYGGTIDEDCTFKNNTYTPLNTTTIISINETAVYTGNDISITTIVLSQKGGFANTGTVEIYINSKLMATMPANTQYIHTTGEIGTYQVLAKFIDDSSYKDSSSTAEFTVIPVDIPEEIETSTAGIFTLEFPDDAEGTLTVFIDGTKYKVYDIIGGILKIDLSDKKGKYNITFEYSGDKNYPAFKKDANITVETNPSITASNAKVIYSAGTTYKITVYKNKGITANNASVVIKQNNKAFKTIKTNSKGVASFKVTQTPGTYKLKITSLGKTVTKTLTVKHIVTLKTATVKKSAKKLILQATLAKVNKKYLKKKTVTFKFNGKTYKAKTNSKGVAKVTIKKSVIKKLKIGKKITYQATYLKDTVKKIVKVKK